MSDPKLIYQLNAINTLSIGQMVYLDSSDNKYKPACSTSLDTSHVQGYVWGFFGNDKFYLQNNISYASYGSPLPDAWFNTLPDLVTINPNDPKQSYIPGNVGDALYLAEVSGGKLQATVPSGNTFLLGYKTQTGFLYRPSLDSRLFSPTLSIKASVDCATTANITLSGEQTIDGITTNTSRVLVKNQTNKVQNGIYVSNVGTWTRSSDGDYGTDLDYTNVFVGGGNSQIGLWVSTGYGYAIDNSEINFVRISNNVLVPSATQDLISGIQTQIVSLSASVLVLQNDSFSNTSTTSGSSATNFVITFTDKPSYNVINPLSQNVTFTTLNKIVGRKVDLRIKDNGISHTIVSPSGWNWISTVAPSASIPNKWIVISLEATDTTDNGIIAEYKHQI